MPRWTPPEPVRDAWSRWAGTLACASVTVLSLLTCLWLGVRSQQTELGQELDERAMDAVAGGEAATARMLGVLGNVSLVTIGLAVAAMVAVAIARARYDAAIAAVLLVLGANLTTQVFKRLLDRHDFGHLTVHSFPSGHATVVASLVLAALLVSPRAARPTVSLLGSAALTITAAATLVASWHRPADVIGAVLISLAWGAGVLTAWSVLHGGVARPEPAPQRVFALVGVIVASVVLVVAGVRPGTGWSGVFDAAAVLAVLGLLAGLVVSVFAHLSAPMAIGDAPDRSLVAKWRRRDVREAEPG